MNLKLKRILSVILCIAFSMALLCGCKNEKTNNSTAENTSDENQYNKEEYVARITAYKEYYEEIENNYNAVNGAILVHKNGSPYMVLCCICSSEEEMDKYKIMLIDYKDDKIIINGEKEFYGEEDGYGGYDNCDVDIAFIDDRCVLRMEISAGECGTEYWEFEKGNLVAQKIGDEENREKVDEIDCSGYVYDIAKKPFVYLYSYGKGKVVDYSKDVDSYGKKIYDTKYTIYDEVSDRESVNEIVVPRLYDYMQLTDEQKEYFVFPKKREDGTEVVVSDVANIYSAEVWMPLSYHRWMNGVSFKQCLNELINEPVYRIEDLMIQELNFDWYNKYSEDISQAAVDRKEKLLKAIEEQMPKYNPYSSDEELLELYYSYVEDVWSNMYLFGGDVPVGSDLATIMTMDGYFANELKKQFEEDYVFNSEKFKGATWKDIVLSGDDDWPILTITKNGNTLTFPVVEDLELKKIVDAYLAYGVGGIGNSFAYIDEDDIPEFISQGNDGSWLMYTYKDGVVTELVRENDDLFRGRLVNYVPKKNKVILDGYDYYGNNTGYQEICIQGNKIILVGPYTENYQSIGTTYRSMIEAQKEITYWNDEIRKVVDEYSSYDIQGNKYNFVYVDEDNIPELVIDNYGVYTVYTYKNGVVTDLELGVELGRASDVRFLSYLPGKNVIVISLRGVENYTDFFYAINEKGKAVGIDENTIPTESYQEFRGGMNVYRALEALIQG